MTPPHATLVAGAALAAALPLTAQSHGAVDPSPTPPPDADVPVLVDATEEVAGPQTDFADVGGGRGQVLADLLGPDPLDPGDPDGTGPPDGVLDLVQVNSNSPALPLGASPAEWDTPPVGTVHAGVVVYRGLPDGTFVDVTEHVTPEASDGYGLRHPCGSPWGAVAADYDDDGDRDIFFPCGGFNMDSANALFANDGDGTFTNVSAAEGFDDASVTFSATWLDHDRDGDLDLFEVNSTEVLPSYYLGQPDPDPTDRLLEYDAVDGFADVAEGAGVALKGTGFSCCASDLDRDGWPDLVLSCYRQLNKVYYNAGDGTFRFMLPDGTLSLDDLVPDPGFPGTVDFGAGAIDPALAHQLPLRGFWSMPVEVQDFNADGWPDICFSSFSNQLADDDDTSAYGAWFLPFDPTTLYLNRGDQDHDGVGDGLFREVAEETGIAHIGGCMGHVSGDFNGDGFPDMYMGGGGPLVDVHLEEDYLYVNNGASWPLDFQADPDQPLDEVFYEVGALAGTYSNVFMAHGLTSARGGGRMDVVVGNGGPGLLDSGQPNVYFDNAGNEGGSAGGYLDVSLVATESAPGGYGTRVDVVRDGPLEAGRVLAQEKRSGAVFASHHDGPLSFGLAGEGALYAGARWPSGVRQGELLWPDGQGAGALELVEPTLSVAFDLSQPAEGGVDLALSVEETGPLPVDASVLFLALTEEAPGVFLPTTVLQIEPFGPLRPGVAFELAAHAASLERGLHGAVVVGGSPPDVIGAGMEWYEPAAAPAGAGEDLGENLDVEAPPFRRRHVAPGRSIEIAADSLDVAPASAPLEWERHELAGEGALGFPGGALCTWRGGAVSVRLPETGTSALCFDEEEAPLLVTGLPLACCDERHAATAGWVVRFEGVTGALEVDGIRYAPTGRRLAAPEAR